MLFTLHFLCLFLYILYSLKLPFLLYLCTFIISAYFFFVSLFRQNCWCLLLLLLLIFKLKFMNTFFDFDFKFPKLK